MFYSISYLYHIKFINCQGNNFYSCDEKNLWTFWKYGKKYIVDESCKFFQSNNSQNNYILIQKIQSMYFFVGGDQVRKSETS